MNADQTQIIEGGKLMLFLNGKSIAMATNHSLSISAETSEISNKDLGSGDWAANAIKKFSWEVTSENMYTQSSYKKLYDLMLAKQPVQAVFTQRDSSLVSDPSTYFAGWTWGQDATTDYLSGNVLITSLDAQAPNDDNATFSCTMTGTGALSYITI